LIRPAVRGDVPAIAAIYAHYVEHTAITFAVRAPSEADWEQRFAQAQEAGHPWFVTEDGFAMCGSFRPLEGYAATVETSIYLAPQARGRGLGTAVYGACLDEAAARGFHVAVAAITLPNDASAALHQKLGFEAVGVMREVGRKLGEWRDVGWWQLPLARYGQPR
jgi:phosphinothricin acetyltransferase